MKKLLLAILISIPILLNAQTPIPNGGMETWTNVGASTEEPTEWNSLMTGNLCGLCAFGAQQLCYRESAPANVHSGTYSCRILTKVILGNPANGVVTIGQVTAPNTTPSNGYNITLQADPLFSEAVTSQPDSIAFWVKYVPQDATDSARVSVVIHDAYNLRDPQDAGSLPHVRSKAVRNFRTGGVYQRIGVPFTIINAGVAPLYILATFTSSKTPGVGTANTTLYIDDVSLVYNPTLTTDVINPLLYYVSASQGAPVTVPYTVTGTIGGGNIFTAQLSDAAGSFAAPVNIGTLASTTSGSISATIPGGTPSGIGYRIRTTASSPAFNGTPNVSDIQIVLVSNPIAPSAPQILEAGTNGSMLTVTETAGQISREWKFSSTMGGPYSSFGPTETNTTYTPNFATVGTYYVVCETTYPNGIVVTSNEVIINVVDNSVTPSSTQSILVGVNGTLLTVTETPAGSAREWKYSLTPGGPYLSFGPTETGTTYMPNFAIAGTYYVVCISTVSGVPCTSNEVIISVGTATLATGVIVGSPFEFSLNAPDATVSVPYTVSTPLGVGNLFTAQLSDAAGSFASPVNIGTLSSINSGNISATISHLTAGGTGYRIRVIANTPSILGSDNGSDLIIDQFDNSVSPTATQNIQYSTNGTAIAVTESQSSTRNWKYSITPGGPYSLFSPLETSASYIPNFANPGTYYVVCVSENTYNDTVVSGEVQINVANGIILNTSALGSSTFYVSPNAVVNVSVPFTSDILFSGGNTFTAEMSDAAGSFASPSVIGTLVSTTVSPITATIPNLLPNGSGYRVRVTSSSPVAVGTNNGTNLSIVQFESNITPPDTQYIAISTNGNTLTINPTHPTGVTHEWKYFQTGSYQSFVPAETNTTYTPNFPATGTYPVTCFSVNMWNDTVQGGTVMVYVSTTGVESNANGFVTTSWNQDQLFINLTNAYIENPALEVINMSGQMITNKLLLASSNNVVQLNIPSGMYLCRISDGEKVYMSKFIKP